MFVLRTKAEKLCKRAPSALRWIIFPNSMRSMNFGAGSRRKHDDPEQTDVVKSESPQERMESALKELDNGLSDDLMEEIIKISSYEFERLVVKLLIKMGYGTMEQNKDAVTRRSNDEGIDGIVSADKFGFDSIYIQAKQWKPDSVVGRPEIQKFLGALAGQGATKGIFITTAQFSKEALDFAKKQLHSKIILVDGKQLTKLMIDYDSRRIHCCDVQGQTYRLGFL